MIDVSAQKTPLRFYQSASGNEPVLEWLKALDSPDRRTVGQDLMRAQWRWPVGMPLCRPMGQGLWEVRTHLPSKRIARVLFCPHDGLLVALHAFVKKTQKTPSADIALARQRQRELKS